MSANFCLIDDLGTIWDGAPPRLRNAFGSTASDDDFSTYVVKNMGFIAVHTYGRSCEIRMRPRIVTQRAFAALSSWVRSHNFERIVTAHFAADDWVYGLHGSGDIALGKLDALLATSARSQPGDYLMRQLSKDQLPRTTHTHRALHALIEDWPQLSQSVSRGGLTRLIRDSLKNRYHLMHVGATSDQLTFGEIGSGFISYSEDWRARSVGAAVSDHEDRNYGKWVAQCCHDAIRSGEPALCDVDAIIDTPRLGRARVRYKRLFLPARGAGNGTWLLTSSILDPTIDLRVEVLDKTA